MKPETRDRLLTGIDSATAKLTQFSTIESVAHWLWEFSGRVHRKMENVRTREQIVALLDAEPEPSPATIRVIEAVIRFAPYLLNRLVKKVAKDALKGLAENPPGPKPVISESEKPLIIAFIRDLYVYREVSVQDAQRRAAMKWSVSFRSIERLWAERDLAKEPKCPLTKLKMPRGNGWNPTTEPISLCLTVSNTSSRLRGARGYQWAGVHRLNPPVVVPGDSVLEGLRLTGRRPG